MDDKKKKFMIPQAEVVGFENDDIVTASSQTEGGNDWDEYPDADEF